MSDAGTPVIECVPNVSEGRDPRIIDALASALARTSGVRLLHVDPGHDAHRTVFTFVGGPEAVADGAIRLGHAVAAHLDMRRHHGAHPRLGALDVCPFVPVRGVTLERCVGVARRVAATLAHDLDLPVYLYEAAAFRPDRRSLVDLRRGEYEHLAGRLAEPSGRPDFGPVRPSPRLGASIVGARPFLIAWNVSLATTDVTIARRIAGRVRASGVRQPGPDGKDVHHPGRLPAVRAVGWAMPSYGHAQVSMNLLDYRITPLHVAYAAVCEEAAREGTQVVGSELIGLVPADALIGTGRALLGDEGAPEDRAVAAAVRGLGLDHLGPFDATARILERRL
jgi:glutamate formiminotransferase/formiminotetrahydrofolate cyclodeaminase